MPMTNELSKPGMCHDEHLLNLWVKDCLFLVDYLSDPPRYVSYGHLQNVYDEKSGYDHIFVSIQQNSFWSFPEELLFCSKFPSLWLKASAFLLHHRFAGN